MIATQLEHVMGLDSMMRQEVYQQLISAKNKELSCLEDVLDKDLKFAVNDESGQRIAVPSVSGRLVRETLGLTPSSSSSSSHSNYNDFYIPPETFAQLEDFRASSQSLAVVMLGIVNNDPDNIERDIALFSSDFNLIQRVRLFPFSSKSFFHFFFYGLLLLSSSLCCCCSHIYIHVTVTKK